MVLFLRNHDYCNKKITIFLFYEINAAKSTDAIWNLRGGTGLAKQIEPAFEAFVGLVYQEVADYINTHLDDYEEWKQKQLLARTDIKSGMEKSA